MAFVPFKPSDQFNMAGFNEKFQSVIDNVHEVGDIVTTTRSFSDFAVGGADMVRV